MPRSVRVAAPATSANLGPGFDAAGLALDWWDTLEVRHLEARHLEAHPLDEPRELGEASQIRPAAGGGGQAGGGAPAAGGGDQWSAPVIVVEGDGAEALSTGAGNLVWRAMRELASAVGATLPPLHLTVTKGFPLGRGFGSSAAAVALGLLAARALVAPDLPDGAVLDLAVKLEGHPDNVAPCLHGGATLCWTGAHDTGGGGGAGGTGAGGAGLTGLASLTVHPDLTAVALVAADPLRTSAARKALPGTVGFDVAARTAGRAALLAPALAGDFDLLFPATDDVLHQPARLALDPAAGHAVAALRQRGHAAFLSGAGPSVLTLTLRSSLDTVRADAEAVAAELPGWSARPVGLTRAGALACVTPAEQG